jgi:tetratricopeptide (TPR) repeat protein
MNHEGTNSVEQARVAVRNARDSYLAEPSNAGLALTIDAYKDLVAVLPLDDPEHGQTIIELAKWLALDWIETQDSARWDAALDLVTGWVDRIPSEDWRWPLYVLAHGSLLYVRADRTGEREIADLAINALEHARGCVRPGSHVNRRASAMLASLYLQRFEEDAEPDDLERSVERGIEAIETQQIGERFQATFALARALTLQAERLEILPLLDTAVSAGEQAVECAPDPHHRGNALGVLATALRIRADFREDVGGLDRAIDTYRASLELAITPDVKASRLGNLANGLWSRYLVTGSEVDCDEAVRLSKLAIDLFPPSHPGKARSMLNLGRSFIARVASKPRPGTLEEAKRLFQDGLSVSPLSKDVELGLHLGLSEALLIDHARYEQDDLLDQAIDALELGLGIALKGDEELPVPYRFAESGDVSKINRLLVGALITRARKKDEGRAKRDLARAFAIGESRKSPLLTQELLRRDLQPPVEADPRDIELESWFLARIAALDAHELAASHTTAPPRRLKRMSQRRNLVRSLNDLWNKMATSPAMRMYVNMRRDLPSAVIHALATRPGNVVLVSISEKQTITANGEALRGFCTFLWRTGESLPELAQESNGELASAGRDVTADIEDRGEVTSEALQPLVNLIPAQAVGTETILAVSPVPTLSNVPWSLVFEHSGWNSAGSWPGVIVLPSLLLAAFKVPEDKGRWHVFRSSAELTDRDVDQEIADSVLVMLQMSTRPTGRPLVVGDPTSDLPSARAEAREIATLLGVNPLIGQDASCEAVKARLGGSPIVHLAAHAIFSMDDPLESRMQLSDGALITGDLIGAWSASLMVVLSACEAASGSTTTGGEVLGLSTVLLRAGVTAVVASLWPADDAATRYLMKCFYAHLKAGTALAVALAGAQRQVRAQPGWSAPYYWAGFVLSQRGDPTDSAIAAAVQSGQSAA